MRNNQVMAISNTAIVGLVVAFLSMVTPSDVSFAQETAVVSAESPTLLIADWLAENDDVSLRYERTGKAYLPILTKNIYRSGRRPVLVGADNVVMYPDVIDTDAIDPDASGLTFEFIHRKEPKKMFFVPFNEGWTAESLKDEGVMIAPPSVKLSGKYVRIGAAEGVTLPFVTTTPPIRIETDSVLEFSVGIEEKTLEPGTKGSLMFQKLLPFPITPLRYVVTVVDDSVRDELFRITYPTKELNHVWSNQNIDLSKYTGKTIQVEFKVEDTGLWKRGELQPGSVLPLWGNPRIYAQTAADKDVPNIIMISLDTLRADHLGAYGYERDTSPFLDELAAESYLFEKCIANSSWTIPSHSSLFTGMPLFTHRMGGKLSWKLDSEFRTVAEEFRDIGYATGAFTEGGALTGSLGFSQGFDWYSDGPAYQVSGGEVTHTFNMAKNWMKYNQNNPFFCFVHTYEIHMPYNPPPLFENKFTSEERTMLVELNVENEDEGYRQSVVDRYDGGIAYTDSMLREFWTQLEDHGLLDNTYVVILSDHGEEFWEHNGVEHGWTLFQEQLHVPLIFHFPKEKAGNKRIPNLVSLSDVFATLLEIGGIEKKKHAPDSQSLVPLMTGKGTYSREAVYSQLVTNLFGLFFSYQTSDWKYMANASYLKADSPIYTEDSNVVIGAKGKNETDFTSAEEQKLLSFFADQKIFSGNIPPNPFMEEPPRQQFLYNLQTDWKERNPLLKDTAAILPELFKEIFAMMNEIDQRATGLTPVQGEDKNLSEEEQEALRALGYVD